MQVSYSWNRKNLLKIGAQLTVVAGICALPMAMRLGRVSASVAPLPAPVQPYKVLNPDPRTVRLAKFLSKLHCPVSNLSEDFIHAADDNSLDWRLLPSISVIESGGGKAYRNNNIFGWNNGAQFFPTLRSGINEVAFKLGKSPLYRGKDVLGKLRLYNLDENYARSVLTVMNRISSVVNLVPKPRVVQQQNQFVYQTD